MAEFDNLEPPRKTGKDYAYYTAKAGVSILLPWLGNATVQAIEDIFGAPQEHKLNSWREAIVEAIREIQTEIRGLRAERLQLDDTFQRAVILASKVASRSDPTTTYPVLKRALVTAGIENDASRDLVCRILRAISSLTRTHIRLLRHFQTNAYLRQAETAIRANLSPERNERNKYLSEDDVERFVVTARSFAYRTVCSRGVVDFGVEPEETKIFITDLIREGLLTPPAEFKWDEETRNPPVTAIGCRLLDLVGVI